MINKKSKAKDVNTEVLQMLNDLFKKLGISGIIYHDSFGVRSMYKNDPARLMILDYSVYEMEIDRAMKQTAAQNHVAINQTKNIQLRGIPSYVG